MFLFLLAIVSLADDSDTDTTEVPLCENGWFCAYYDRSACTFRYFRKNCMRMCDTCPPNDVNALQEPPNNKWAQTFKNVRSESSMSQIRDAAGFQHIRGEEDALKVLKGRFSDPNAYNAPVRYEEDPFQSELFIKPETSLSYIYVPLYVFLFISCMGLFVVWFSVKKRKQAYRLIAERNLAESRSSPYGSV